MSVVWDFGDGQSLAVGANSQVAHAYSVPGAYTARITAVDNLGVVTSNTFIITANAQPGPNTPPRSSREMLIQLPGLLLTPVFTANVTDNVQVMTVTWFFGDGQSQVVTQNGVLPYSNTVIQHTYSSPGTYAPMIMATDNAGLTLL